MGVSEMSTGKSMGYHPSWTALDPEADERIRGLALHTLRWSQPSSRFRSRGGVLIVR